MVEDGVEFSGRTVADAIAQAETYFGVPGTDLGVQVITPGRGGVFGIGAEQARIRVRPPAQREPSPPQVTPASPPPSAAVPSSEVESVERARTDYDDDDQTYDDRDEDQEREAEPVTAASAAALPADATQVLERLLETMGFDATVSVRSTENPIILAVTGQNLGVLIGRRGDNLASLQFMVNLILSKGRRQWPRVVIDVENYRARREESLKSLADRIAYRVGRSGRPFTLEAMPASDRRVIHLSLRERNGVETYSIGEGVARRVVIAPIRTDRYDNDPDE